MTLGQLRHKLQILTELKVKHKGDKYIVDHCNDLIESLTNEINNLEMSRASQVVFNALREKGLS